MKRYIITSALALSLLAGTAAFAQTTAPAPRPETLEARQELRNDIREKRADFKTEAQEKRADLRDTLRDTKGAITDDLKARREALLQELKEKREAMKEEIAAKREVLKEEIEKVRKERAVVRKGYVEQKLRQVIVVITDRQERVQKAIDTLKDKGAATTEAEKHLDESKTALKTATEKLEALTKIVVTDNEPKPLEEARKLAKEIEAALKSAREHLVLAIQELKLINRTDDDSDDATDEDESNDDSGTDSDTNTN